MKYLVFPLSRLVFGGVQDAWGFFFWPWNSKSPWCGGFTLKNSHVMRVSFIIFLFAKTEFSLWGSGSIALNLISKTMEKKKMIFIHTASGFLHINSWQILGALALTQRVCLAAEWCRMRRLDGTHLKDLESLKKSKASSHDSMQLRFNLVRVMMSQTSYPLYPT